MQKSYYKKIISGNSCPICGKLYCKYYGSSKGKDNKRIYQKMTRQKLKGA